MSRLNSIIDRGEQECKYSVQELFFKMYERVREVNEQDWPPLRLRYMVDDYHELIDGKPS